MRNIKCTIVAVLCLPLFGGCYEPLDLNTSETWTDESSGLTWQRRGNGDGSNGIDNAQAFCEGLTLDGYDDWRLPTVDELLALVDGCTATQACTVDLETCVSQNCSSVCDDGSGPGVDGCYWPDELLGWCGYYLTTTECGSSPSPWWVDFMTGTVSVSGGGTYYNFWRCVRGGD